MSRDWFESCGPDSEGAERVEEKVMDNFKVGDQVRIVANGWGGKYPVGHIEKVTEVFDGGIRVDEPHGNNYPNSNIELLARHTIQLNHQYTSKNGQKWECIAVRGDTAWMASGIDGEAYRFLLNGENLSQGGGEWDIKWEPVVEWRTNTAHLCDDGGSYHMGAGESRKYSGGVTVTIKYPLVDGKPDFTQSE